MHTSNSGTTVCVRSRTARIVGVILALAVFAVTLSALAAPAIAGERRADGVFVLASPRLPDGPLGWYRSPVTINLVPRSPGTVYYSWDDPFGRWEQAAGPIIAPEGKHILYSRLVSSESTASAMSLTPVSVDYRAHAPVRAQAAAAGGTVLVTVRINPTAGTRVIRIGGADRYETAAMVSSTNFDRADTVVLATGSGFADALSASGLAGCVEGPVLLTRQTALPAHTSAEIKRLGAKRVIIVGGEAAVASTVAARVAALGVTVERIGGRDRYATAAMISSRVVGFGQSGGRIFIARGDAFADALSLGPLAYAGKAPLILVQPTTVPPATRSFLSAHSFSSGCLAGGTVAVSNRVRNELALYVPGIARLAGDSRYDTAVAVAAWGVSNGLVGYQTVGIATGVNFADALCGGIAAGSAGGVILLTPPDDLHPATSAAIAGSIRDTRNMQVYGGEAAVSSKVMSSISAMSR